MNVNTYIINMRKISNISNISADSHSAFLFLA